MTHPTPQPAPAPHRSPRSSRKGVHAIDSLAELTITVGGISVIVAVLGICVYLAAQVVPLFRSGQIEVQTAATSTPAAAIPAIFRVDEYRAIALTIGPDGNARTTHIASGAVLAEKPLAPEGATIASMGFEPISGLLALGLTSGQVSLGSVSFDASGLGDEELTPAIRSLPVGGSLAAPADETHPLGSVVQRVSETQFRRLEAVIKQKKPADIKDASSPIHAIDYRESSGREFMTALRADGKAALDMVTTITPLGGGAPRVEFEEYDVPFRLPAGRDLPRWFFVTGDGTSIIALWEDGFAQRYSCGSPESKPIQFAEELTLLPAGRKITTARMLLGGLTVLIGDDSGFLTRAFAAVDPSATTVDGQKLVVAASARIASSPITAITTSIRDRCIAITDADGNSGVFNTISDKWVLPMGLLAETPAQILTIAPKVDGLVALGAAGQLTTLTLDKGYPEASFKSLFGKVHYEGKPQAEFVYQAATGEDTAEVKYSLIPLIHGTLKSTVFAMIFAVPLAVLSAVYTSEFLSRRARRVVKPTIEMMASLPSVVLGFIAAIVLAPIIADRLPSILMLFFTMPVGMLLGGFVWQLIPRASVKRIPPLVKLAAMVAVFGGSTLAAGLIGPAIEHALFRPTHADRLALAEIVEPVPASEIPAWVGNRTTMNGADRRELRESGLYFVDGKVVRTREPANAEEANLAEHGPAVEPFAAGSLRGWLDGNFGDAFPGWFLLLIGPAAVAATLALRATIGPRIDAVVEASPQFRGAMLELLRFIGVLGGTLVVAFLAARTLSIVHVDARDFIVGGFSQRNSLVVGLIMGFAIIPIIYTISEDAMAAVPNSLRSASLGAGATPWQTATRVVMPVAASGIFSAIMIGLGRAVGETMIVVMATGNTPEISWNMFSGCRTLSANIATELPEAGHGDVHFRILFLCGLVLFVMTFALNTTAEIIRQRFRKRNAAL